MLQAMQAMLCCLQVALRGWLQALVFLVVACPLPVAAHGLLSAVTCIFRAVHQKPAQAVGLPWRLRTLMVQVCLGLLLYQRVRRLLVGPEVSRPPRGAQRAVLVVPWPSRWAPQLLVVATLVCQPETRRRVAK